MAAVEVFANSPVTSVTSGGTTAPAPGTSQSWTVLSSSSFPAASTGVTQFHVVDTVLPSEIILVTNVSGTTWTVTRGAESTTPVAHTAGFTVFQVVTAGFLNSVGVTGQYLCAANAYAPGSRTAVTVSSTTMAAWSTGNICTNSFTAPASGRVLVTLNCVMSISAAGNNIGMALAATGTVTPVVGNVITHSLAGSGTLQPETFLFPVTGLTPGNSYQFDLLGCASNTFTATIEAWGQAATTIQAAGAPAVMTVQAA